MKNLKLFPKLFLLTLIPFGIVVILIHLAIYLYMPQFYFQKEKVTANFTLERFTEQLEQKSLSDILLACETYAKEYSVNLTVLTNQQSYEFHGFKAVQISTTEPFPNNELIVSSDFSPTAFILQKNFSDKEGKQITLQCTSDLRSKQQAICMGLNLLPYTISFSFFMTLIIAYVTSFITTKPIKQMVEITTKMSNLEKGIFYPVTGKDELNVLGAHMNAMYQNLLETIDDLEKEKISIQTLEADKINFLRATSHDLKTPLTSLQVLLENMRFNIGKYKDHDKYLDESIVLVNRLTKMIQTILDSSTLTDNIYTESFSPTRFDIIMENTLTSFQLIASSKHIKIVKNLDQPLLARCTDELAGKVCSNLISNAIRYTKDGGTIELFIKDNTLYVRNECVPLSEEECRRVFEPLYRTDLSRNQNSGGNGLGLYLVKQILSKANLSFTFVPYEHGMSFEITFPQNFCDS